MVHVIASSHCLPTSAARPPWYDFEIEKIEADCTRKQFFVVMQFFQDFWFDTLQKAFFLHLPK